MALSPALLPRRRRPERLADDNAVRRDEELADTRIVLLAAS